MNGISVVFLTAAALAVAAAQAAGEAPADLAAVRAAVDAGNARYLAAFKSRDAEAMTALFTEDGAMLQPGMEVVRGREAIRDTWQQWMQANLVDGTITTVDLEASGDLAYELGTFRFTYRSEAGEERTRSGKYLVVWKRQADGGWRIHVDAGLPDG